MRTLWESFFWVEPPASNPKVPPAVGGRADGADPLPVPGVPPGPKGKPGEGGKPGPVQPMR